MVFPILCNECSEDLAEVSRAFTLILNKLDFNSKMSILKIFIILRINNMCCRTHMLGQSSNDVEY